MAATELELAESALDIMDESTYVAFNESYCEGLNWSYVLDNNLTEACGHLFSNPLPFALLSVIQVRIRVLSRIGFARVEYR